MSYFVDVILPIPLRKLFTYGVNQDEAHFLKPGIRVAVSFGKSKVYTALVFQVHTNQPTYQTKDIEYILDETPVVNQLQLQHWQWISEFYMCSLGEVFKMAMPSSFLLESETIIEKSSRELEINELTDDELLVYEALNFKTALTGNEVAKIVGNKKALKVLKGLVDKNAIKISEKIFEKYVPKLVKYIRLSSEYQSDEGIKKAFDILSKATKQKQLIVAYFNCINKEKGVLKAEKLLSQANVSASVLKSVVEKGIFEEYFIQKDRINFTGDLYEKKILSDAQQESFLEIQNQFQEKEIILFQGVTASGKTEIYIELIDQVLKSGKQVLYLLPEIGLTVHLINRLKKYFGDKMGVYHSKYTTNERVEVWNNVLNGNTKNQLVVGVRSSVFLPFSNLGLVIVDEEHDTSYRQFEPAPRFHTRDAAIVLSKIHKAKVLLGSATPSLESLYNAKREKYGYVYLSKRFGDFQVPDIEIIDIKDKHFRKQMTGHFSDELIEEIGKTLQKGNQVILFQNQRGYAPVIQCKSCATVPQCPHCDVSLTYHQGRNQLRCHYCGYAIAKPEVCIACGSTDLITKGVGTEQIAKELTELFPDVTIDRMDQDTTSGKYGYEKILSKFEQRETQILVGTQMISKGLDFENVGLVGVMNADSFIHFPDFRAYERSFQLLVQISGRAGRSSQKGKVLIQTYSPKHPVLQQVLHNNFKEMFQSQIKERKEFHYPPFVRLIKITFKHSDFNKVNEGAEWFAEALRQGFSQQQLLQVLGPEFPLVSRIRNEYIKDILVKIPPEISVESVKKYILRTEISFQSVANFRSVRVIFNVE
ncbi:replication restart helicase PriA [Capnocytophaga cynodegmi]|uniref:Replication restart protein PriA n=1 Tax=Capnocytophaga cynodegmi TaxID=28189 RepID=A0A0B7HUC3_9FLAO|nr:primosomal protein N' [Capnocytophaga cynodegmi]CEN41522.1 Primosomal protein N [Capnocytophaga cynodegmi]